MNEIVSKVVAVSPVLGYALQKSVWVAKEDIPTIQITGTGVIEYNPSFWDSLSGLEKITLCLHEILHLVLKHHERGVPLIGKSPSYSDMRLFNIAADIVVNEYLVHYGYTYFPGERIHCIAFLEELGVDTSELKHSNITLENVFHILSNLDNGKKAVLGQGLDNVYNEDAKLSPPDKELQKVSRQFGLDPISKALNQFDNVDWSVIVKNLIDKVTLRKESKRSYRRESRRDFGGLLLKGKVKIPKQVRILVLVDVSQSIPQSFIKAAQKCVSFIPPEAYVKVVAHNDQLLDIDIMGEDEVIGRGLTSFVPGFNLLEEEQFDLVLWITDGVGEWPRYKPTKQNTVFVLNRDIQIPFNLRKVILT